jgi:type II secretory pathway pseudopilin PulG
MKTRRKKQEERGFVLVGVILVLAIIVAAVTMTLSSSTDTIREQNALRNGEIAQAALSHGLAVALEQLQQSDPVQLYEVDYDIFDPDPGVQDFTPSISYPPNGPHAGEVTIRVGLAPLQRTQAPAGEDVRNTYGYVFEVQLSAEMTGFGSAAEERVSVGVQIPHDNSHSK